MKRAPKVTVRVTTNRPHGLPPIMLLAIAGVDRAKSRQDRRNVELLIERSGKKGELFLLCELGTMGRTKYLQWYARILPEQIDNLLACLTVARKNLHKLGVKIS